MAIGAHPDDVEFSMGGSIAHMREAGSEIMILDITDGEPTPHGSKEIRKSESLEAAKILDVERKTLEFSNRFLFDDVEVRKGIAGEIRLFKPDIIFAHYPLDAHPDHLSASQMSMAARFYGKLSYIDLPGERFFAPRIFYFFSVHLRISPQPDFCLDISSEIDTKVKALLAYKSQFHEINKSIAGGPEMNKEERVANFIKTQNGYWGNRIGAAYAEPFYSPEILGFSNLNGILL
jgi:bacillithiol biosynthesis deacetylase BshB1